MIDRIFRLAQGAQRRFGGGDGFAHPLPLIDPPNPFHDDPGDLEIHREWSFVLNLYILELEVATSSSRM